MSVCDYFKKEDLEARKQIKIEKLKKWSNLI